jgi:hypothetical protein
MKTLSAPSSIVNTVRSMLIGGLDVRQIAMRLNVSEGFVIGIRDGGRLYMAETPPQQHSFDDDRLEQRPLDERTTGDG